MKGNKNSRKIYSQWFFIAVYSMRQTGCLCTQNTLSWGCTIIPPRTKYEQKVKSKSKLTDMNLKLLSFSGTIGCHSFLPDRSRLLQTFPGLKYILPCLYCLPTKLIKFFEKKKSGKTYLWHLYSIMFILCTKAKKKKIWKRKKLIIGCLDCISNSFSNVATLNEKGFLS